MDPDASYKRVKEYVAYGKGTDRLLSKLKDVLSANPMTQKIIIEAGTSQIYIEKLVAKNPLEENPEVSWQEAIRHRPLEEYKPEEKLEPHQQLWEMFALLHREGLEVTQLLCGDKIVFQKWLKVRIPIQKMSVFGVPVEIISDLPDDVFILCGSMTRDAGPEDLMYSVKGVIS